MRKYFPFLVSLMLITSVFSQPDEENEIPIFNDNMGHNLPISTTIYPYDGFNQTCQTLTVRCSEGSYIPILHVYDNDPWGVYSVIVDFEVVLGNPIYQSNCDPMITFYEGTSNNDRYVLVDDYSPTESLYPRFHGDIPTAYSGDRTYCVEGYNGQAVYVAVILNIKHTRLYYNSYSSMSIMPQGEEIDMVKELSKLPKIRVEDWTKKKMKLLLRQNND